MDVLRRNTDYALRMMVNLASCFNGELMSARQLASEGNFSYQLACKLLQKLHKAKLVRSGMGPKGGFRLSREPSKISLLDIIIAIQGPVRLNRCLMDTNVCPYRQRCSVSKKLAELQKYIDRYLGAITLDELLKSKIEKKRK